MNKHSSGSRCKKTVCRYSYHHIYICEGLYMNNNIYLTTATTTKMIINCRYVLYSLDKLCIKFDAFGGLFGGHWSSDYKTELLIFRTVMDDQSGKRVFKLDQNFLGNCFLSK